MCRHFSQSTSSVLDSSLELISLLDSCHELLDQLEPPEAPEAEPQGKENSGPAPVHTEVPPGELMPAPPAAPSAALAPQQEPVPGSPAPPAAELELLVSPQLVSSLELHTCHSPLLQIYSLLFVLLPLCPRVR
ncbi:myosin-binding protein H-like [Fukomys damarensis]|uniref:myosin-binding protein H-like n=1 Tax=Fukomys damarensis TaxID=885580 RepID=UPI0005400CE8|nr:myosin-binding protein H-like [Fukomys damarensis]